MQRSFISNWVGAPGVLGPNSYSNLVLGLEYDTVWDTPAAFANILVSNNVQVSCNQHKPC